MLLLSVADYIKRREQYSYNDPDVDFIILQTGTLPFVGKFQGIYPANIPPRYGHGINLRKFEIICQTVFLDCSHAISNAQWTRAHLENIKHVTCTIVHWKMSSQGGRAGLKTTNVLSKWGNDTHKLLIDAYNEKSLKAFKIGGVRIPTATAFLRFLYPEEFGIMDSRVAGNYTNPQSITHLSLREDGYITDVKKNMTEYNENYVSFLKREAGQLNAQGATYSDIDQNDNKIKSKFRPCDVEMALF